MKDRQLLTTTDTKLLFRQQRVRNTRIAIRRLEEWLSAESKLDFPGRIFTSEYYDKMIRLKFHKAMLKELERNVLTYRNKMYRRKKAVHL